MIFRSKVDTFYRNFMLIVVIIIGVGTFWPFLLEGGTDMPVVITLSLTFLIITGFLLWSTFSAKYVFKQEYLFVRGGLFRSRIPYEHITKVAPTTAVFTGYRIMSARDGIEIFYKNAAFGSVKISPLHKKEFIHELRKRCPNANIEV